MVIKTEAQLRQLGNEWQIRLRLRDWNVKYELTSVHDVDNSFANSRVNPKVKEAQIRICKSDQLDEQWLGNSDMEVTLVHELLHIPCSGFDSKVRRGTAEYNNYEAFIELTANALVNAKRQVVG